MKRFGTIPGLKGAGLDPVPDTAGMHLATRRRRGADAEITRELVDQAVEEFVARGGVIQRPEGVLSPAQRARLKASLKVNGYMGKRSAPNEDEG